MHCFQKHVVHLGLEKMSEFQDYLSPAPPKDVGSEGQFRIVLAELSLEQLVPWCTKVRRLREVCG